MKVDLDKILVIDKFLGTKRNMLNRVGVELEGGWERLPDGANLVRDGSVIIPEAQTLEMAAAAPITVTPADLEIGPDGNLRLRRAPRPRVVVPDPEPSVVSRPRIHVGELPLPPLQLSEVPRWIRESYPSHVNDTCGMHVHMSFKNARHYGRLMVPEYTATMVAYLTRWALSEDLPKRHPIWPRLRGENQFCKLEFYPDAQAGASRKNYGHNGEGNRYTAINYCYKLEERGTLECRILPMMDNADIAIRAIQQVASITNACLMMLRGREEKLAAELRASKDVDPMMEDSTFSIQPTQNSFSSSF